MTDQIGFAEDSKSTLVGRLRVMSCLGDNVTVQGDTLRSIAERLEAKDKLIQVYRVQYIKAERRFWVALCLGLFQFGLLVFHSW